MCRKQKKKLSLSLLTASLFLLTVICFCQRAERQGTELCTVKKYKNLEVPVSELKEISREDAKNMIQSLCEEKEIVPTEEMEQMIFQSLVQEKIYEAEMEKREAVLRKIFQYSTISGEVDNPEEAVLLAVYDQAGLTLTEKEKKQGVMKLQEVFGAASAEELGNFLTEEEQLRIIKKEKTYEYLLKNNRFVTVSSAPLS